LDFVAFLNAEDPTATFAMTQVIVLSTTGLLYDVAGFVLNALPLPSVC
jgi:hypothetical protein